MLVRVFEVPAPDGQFCFGSGRPKTFIEVDWFRDDDSLNPDSSEMMTTEEGRQTIREFVMGKTYFKPEKAYLVLSQAASFTIGYSAP